MLNPTPRLFLLALVLVMAVLMAGCFGGGAVEATEDGLIYDYLVNQLGINFAHIDEYLEPICLKAEDARLLGVKSHTPALLITKVSYDQRDAWLEYSRTTIRGDKCRYHVSLK